uniref:Uncharacterized protein n=1 Tax=Oryza barthii TaxID=65489 RepID=A0A0D3FXF5_9ORYZ
MTGWAEPSSHRFCSRDPPSTATGGADPATLPLPHVSRLLSARLSRGSVASDDERVRSGDLFPSRNCCKALELHGSRDESNVSSSSPSSSSPDHQEEKKERRKGSSGRTGVAYWGGGGMRSLGDGSPISRHSNREGIPAKFIQGY